MTLGCSDQFVIIRCDHGGVNYLRVILTICYPLLLQV